MGTAAEPACAGWLGPPARVLLVEDNPGDADLTVDILAASALRIDVAVVPDGVRALRYLRERLGPVPDIILLDLNLPMMSGGEVLAELKRDPALRHIPVMILSSSDAERDVAATCALGATCYLTKPVGMEAYRGLARAVEQVWLTVERLG